MNRKHEDFIRNHFEIMSVEKLRRLFNQTFGTDYKTSAFYYHTQRLGLRKHNQHQYTDAEERFLKENAPNMTRKELTEMFNEMFGASISEMAIEQRVWQKGYKAKSDGRFKQGSVPWEKTEGGREAYLKKLHMAENTHRFPKGHRPHNAKVVGSERKTDRGVFIKTRSGWKLKQNVIYGNVKKGSVVIFADGNKDNFCKDNLRRVSNRTFIKLHRNGWLYSGQEIVDAGIECARLENLLVAPRKD